MNKQPKPRLSLRQKIKPYTGFSLIELLVVIGIIGVLATIAIVNIFPVTKKARDTKRKADLAQIGRFLSMSCFLPDTGGGEYDLSDLVGQLKIKYPQYAGMLANAPRDPKIGDETNTHYKYLVTADAKKCALYANLENEAEPITLGQLTAPAPGGGTGVLSADTEGANGTRIYFQYSN